MNQRSSLNFATIFTHAPLTDSIFTRSVFTNAIFAIVLTASAFAAGSPKTLHAFQVPGNSNDGGSLYSSLTLDSSGNAYGTTVSGGLYNAGIVYELSPTSGGQWKETILYNFKGGSQDGSGSHATPVFDSEGNLYGSTVSGGLNWKECNAGCGVVFKLSPPASGEEWTETILHLFTGGSDGGAAYAGVIFDTAGNLYGATAGGGRKGFGTVYKLSPTSGGAWQEIVLHNFTGKPDGDTAFTPLAFDSAGNLYGTTYAGGANNQGAVYQLAQNSGAWKERVLYSFKGGHDGAEPFAGVVIDAQGNLYGTTQAGGTARVGIAYELDAANHFAEIILHQFLGLSAGDGANPNSLVFDQSGNLYGTTVGGGKFNPGTIFRLSLSAHGWKETVLYSFTAGDDGAYPSAGPSIDAQGNIYGTTLWGGPAGDTVGGVAFQYIP